MEPFIESLFGNDRELEANVEVGRDAVEDHDTVDGEAELETDHREEDDEEGLDLFKPYMADLRKELFRIPGMVVRFVCGGSSRGFRFVQICTL